VVVLCLGSSLGALLELFCCDEPFIPAAFNDDVEEEAVSDSTRGGKGGGGGSGA